MTFSDRPRRPAIRRLEGEEARTVIESLRRQRAKLIAADETAHLLRSPRNAKRLRDSIREMNEGRGAKFVRIVTAWALYRIGAALLTAGDRIMVASERVQGSLEGPWL